MASNESLVFLNGMLMPRKDAKLDIEDRAGLFGDGVYEVIRVYHARPLGMAQHVERLHRSLKAIGIPVTQMIEDLPKVSEELIARNQMPEAKLYWQISRGAAARDHVYSEKIEPTVMAIAYPLLPVDPHKAVPMTKVIVEPDVRWHECWIKSLMLLPNVMARAKAKQMGATEAILHREGVVTEGAATNAFLVRKDEIFTHRADHWILAGVTRGLVIQLARENGIKVHEQAFKIDEIKYADELFITGTTTHVTGISHVDGQRVGSGNAGEITTRLHKILITHILKNCVV